MQGLRTARLRLTPPRPRDWAALPVLRDPLAPDAGEMAVAAQVFAEWADLSRERGAQDGGGWVLTRGLTRRPLGLLLYAPDADAPRAAALSIALNADVRGRGFATEALAAALGALDGGGGFDRLTAIIAPCNTPCRRLFLRAGFVLEQAAPLRTSRGEAEGLRFARTTPRMAEGALTPAGRAPPRRPAPAGSGSGRPERTAWAHP